MKEKKNICTGCAAAEADGRFVRHPEGADGEAVVTAYPMFPGIEIAYCDIHAHECRLEHTPEAPLMRISHCREGRLEQQMGNEYYFLAPGDLAVSRSDASDEAARFPTGHYHGITVTIDPAQAPECLSCLLSDVNVRPAALMEKFCADGGYFAARSSASVEHIFSELYSVPEEIRKGYFKVKVLELLLFLSALPTERRRPAYSGAQVRLASAVSEYLLSATEERPTTAELSAKFHAFDGKSMSHNTLTGRTVWNALLAQIALVFRKQKGLLLVDVVAHFVQNHEFDPVQSVHHAQR